MTNPFAAEYANAAIVGTSGVGYELGYLNGKSYPISGFVNYTNMATFQGKFTIGDPTEDSDPVFSVWSQDDWTGGGQVYDLNELSDVQRFYDATAETTYPRLLSLPLATFSYTIPDADGDCQPIGDYKPFDTTLFYAAGGTKLAHWDTGTQAFIADDDLAAAPVNKAKSFNGLLWIPQGDSGYDTWDGTSVTHGTDTTIKPVSFELWDNKILALSGNGQVSTFDPGGGTWDSDPAKKLLSDETMRNLVTWWDQSGNPAVYIVTNGSVWVIDPVVPTLYKTGLSFPTHPDQGLASCTWRDDSMYVSVGMGVHQLARGDVISAMGLDHNDGMPSEFRGAIVDLEPEYNGMLALINGIANVSISGDDDEGLGENVDHPLFDEDMIIPSSSSTARSNLQRWTGTGWHTVWQSDGATGTATRTKVSQADGEYRLWWGYGGNMYTQTLRRTFYNPRDGMLLGIDQFKTDAYLRTGQFDANMAGFFKGASHLEIRLDQESNGWVDTYYQTDANYPNWEYLGRVSGTGHHFLPFYPDGSSFPGGLPFRWVEFKYQLSSANASVTPIVKSFVLKFRKIPLLTRSWSFVISLDFPEQMFDRGAQQMCDELDVLAANAGYYLFQYRNRTFRVCVSQVTGKDAVGKDLRSGRTVSVLQLGLPLISDAGDVHTTDVSDVSTQWEPGW